MWIMGIDQYGTEFHDLGEYPRKSLLNRLGRKRAEKMYVDDADSNPKHIGYIIAGHWIRLYRVEEWSR